MTAEIHHIDHYCNDATVQWKGYMYMLIDAIEGIENIMVSRPDLLDCDKVFLASECESLNRIVQQAFNPKSGKYERV